MFPNHHQLPRVGAVPVTVTGVRQQLAMDNGGVDMLGKEQHRSHCTRLFDDTKSLVQWEQVTHTHQRPSPGICTNLRPCHSVLMS